MLKGCFLISLVFLLINTLSFNMVDDMLDSNFPFINVENKNDYHILEIPKINLEKRFYPDDINLNDVDKGIEVIYPNNNHNTLLLASHSGNSSIAYFNKLEELTINDEFYIKNGNTTNKYLIIKQDYKEKNGILSLSNLYEGSVILLTCSHKYPDKQVYYIGKKENI